MSTQQNKDVVRRFIEEIFVKCNVDAADELATPDFTPHSWPGVGPGIENLKQGQRRVSSGLADISMKVDDMIAEDDRVAVRLTAHARQDGEFMGLPPSGKEYTISETHVFRLTDGKVAEHWVNADMLGLMQQLGAMGDQARKEE
jgi:predicted ester cyclase